MWIIGLALTIAAIIVRGIRFRTRTHSMRFSNWQYWGLLWITVVGSIFAGISFYHFTTATPPIHSILPTDPYAAILTVLSLLAGGAFAGFCAVDYQLADNIDEIWILAVISGLFSSFFYLLFFAISYYIGESGIGIIHGIPWVITIAMTLLLIILAVIDFWDYCKHKDGENAAIKP